MQLSKLFVAIGISFMLVLFLTNLISAVYKAPKIDYSKCYSYSSSSLSASDACVSILERECGQRYSSNYTCYTQITSSTEYKNCINSASAARQECIDRQNVALTIYMIIYYVLLSFLSIALITAGFLFLKKESIGAGLIGGGVLLMLLAGVFSAVNSVTSLVSSYSSLYSSGSTTTTSTNFALPLLSILFPLIVLIILFAFAFLKLERE